MVISLGVGQKSDKIIVSSKKSYVCGPFEEVSFKNVDDDLRYSGHFLNNFVCVFFDQDINQVLSEAGEVLLSCDDKSMRVCAIRLQLIFRS